MLRNLLFATFYLLCSTIYSQGNTPCTATTLTPTTSCSNTSGTLAGSTSANNGFSTPTCASYSSSPDVWYKFTAPASGIVTITLTAGTLTDSGMSLYSATNCSTSLSELYCDDDSGSGSMSAIAATGLTNGNVYYIRIWDYFDAAAGTFDICIVKPNDPPANDTPCGAISLSVNSSCVNTSATNVGAIYATNNFGAPSCGTFGSSPDVWFSFVAPASGSVQITTSAGTLTDSGMSLYSATNCTTGASEITCDDNSGPGSMSQITTSGLVSGSTYYIRVWEYFGGTGTFDICIISLTPPANDNPCSATTLTVNSSCSYSLGTNVNATASSGIPAPGCASYVGGDVWYKSVVPASGSIKFNSDSVGITDGGMAIYSGTCGSLTLISCDDYSSQNPGDMPMLTVSGRTPGETLFIRFWSYSNTESGTFGICALTVGPCGNESTNDFCSNPAILTKGASSWNSTTSDLYSSDTPDNLDPIFCGSIENNSWYKFTASSTSETFNFTSVYNCANADGIQAEVYSLTASVNGCCSVFASKSNCWNPGTPTSGVVTASGLTVGQDYYLMVDGYSGDACSFTVSGWSASGILLPVELLTFEIYAKEYTNKVFWETASELNNDYFEIEKSTDGILFEQISIIDGHQNSTKTIHYSFDDYDIRSEISYYRLVQYDFNGNKKTTKIKSVKRNAINEKKFTVYPNPASHYFIVKFNGKDRQKGTVELISTYGDCIMKKNIDDDQSEIEFNVESISSGIYMFKYISENGKIEYEKVEIK